MSELPIWLVPGEGKVFVKSRLPKMPSKAPACFDSQRQWNSYKFIADWLGNRRKLPASFNCCVDCTPEYRDKMHAEGRCPFPATTFKRVNRIIIGVRHAR